MFTFLTLLLWSRSASAEDPVNGIWQSMPEDGFYSHILIEPCGDRICGKLIRIFSEDGTEVEDDLVGKQVIWDMKASDNRHYDGGNVWRAADGKTYSGKMEIDGDVLTVSGCFMLICKGKELKRVVE
jgi:uncharacterized protein (DUF2147 family)